MQAELVKAILDSLSQQMTILDTQCNIQWVNRVWMTFYEQNGGKPIDTWIGVSRSIYCRTSILCSDILFSSTKNVVPESWSVS